MTGKDEASGMRELLQAIELPVFSCDEQGRLLDASPKLTEIFGDELPSKASVYDVFSGPSGGKSWQWQSSDGKVWQVELRSLSTGFAGWLQEAVVAEELGTSIGEERQGGEEAWLDDVDFSSLPMGELTRAVFKELTLPKRDEELLQSVITVCQRLVPDRLYCVRLIETESGELSKVLATGHLEESARDSVSLTRRSLGYFGRPMTLPPSVEISEEYQRLFERSAYGFDIPLHDGETLLGVLNVEYVEGTRPDVEDSKIIGFVCILFSGALRFSRMLGDSVYTRDYFIKLLDTANAPILVTDRHRRIKLINKAFESLTGYSRSETLGRDIKTFLSPRERERLLPAVVNALRGRAIGNLEVRIPHKEGRGTAHIALSLSAVRSGFGDIEGVVAIGQDLTELRKLQQQVIHSEKLATIGQLAAGVVHELNNPLTSISVYSEFLLKKVESEGGDAGDITKLERICEGAERILKFTRDLVAYARPAAEEPRLVDLRDVIEQSLVFCEHVVERARVTVIRRFDDDIPPVYGVKGQLQQILVNLITNACDAMSETEAPRLTVLLRREGERVQLSLEDNGPGIPPSDRMRVFEPFFSTKPEGQGTGLGLSIVRNILTNHDGRVRVEEGEQGGSRFIVELFASS